MAQRNRAQRLNGLFPLSYMGVIPVSPVNFVIDDRDPTINDSKNFYIGDLWLNNDAHIPPKISDLWMLVSLVGNDATWINFGQGNIDTVPTDFTSPAIPIGGILNIFGGVSNDPEQVALVFRQNIHTAAITNTVFVKLNDSLSLPDTTANGLAGVVYQGGVATNDRFIHSFGFDNTFVGSRAGNFTLIALSDTGIGAGALQNITSGSNSVAVGAGALSGTTIGAQNTAVGAFSGNVNDLSRNVFVGHASFEVGTGFDNVIVGADAASNLVGQADNNIIIGSSAGSAYTTTESDNILIGNIGTITDANVIRLGTDGTGSGQQSECFVAGNLHLLHNIYIEDTTSNTQGVVFQGGSSDSDRLLHTFTGSVVPNTFLGHNAGNFTAIVGSGANVGIGPNTLENHSSAGNSTAIGFNALNDITTGGENTSVGAFSAVSMQTGTDVVSIGFQSFLLGEGSNNTIVGSQASANITGTATDNIIVGFQAATNFTTTESSNIIIGNPGILADNNTIRIGADGGGAGQQSKAFMGGINGNTVGSPLFVTIDSATSQLGTTAASPTGLSTAFLAHQDTQINIAVGAGVFYQFGASEILVEVYDIGSDFTPGDGLGTPAIFTAPADGYYYLSMYTETLNGAGDNAIIHPAVQIVTTTTTYSRPTPKTFTGQLGGLTYGHVSILAFMNATDTATFEVAGNNGGAGGFDLAGGATPIVSYCYGYRVG